MPQPLPLCPFYLVRHGRSRSNELGVMAGIVDTPLVSKGVAQAAALAAALGALSPAPDRMVCSAMARTRDTGAELNKPLNLCVSELPSLNERDFGLWAGEKAERVFADLERGIAPPEGESLPAFAQRVAQGLCEVLRQGGRPLIVAHGGTFDALAFLYGCQFVDVGNVHLYAFDPAPENAPFPWRVKRGAPQGDRLIWREAQGDVALLSPTPGFS